MLAEYDQTRWNLTPASPPDWLSGGRPSLHSTLADCTELLYTGSTALKLLKPAVFVFKFSFTYLHKHVSQLPVSIFDTGKVCMRDSYTV